MKAPRISTTVDDLVDIFRDGRERTINDVLNRMKVSEDTAKRLLEIAVTQGKLRQGGISIDRGPRVNVWRRAA